MSVAGFAIGAAKFTTSSIAAVAGALDFSAIFTSACGGGFNLLSGKFADVADPLISRADHIGIMTATLVVAGGTRYGLGRLFPAQDKPAVSP